MNRKVATHLMFQGSASSAMELYRSVFPGFRVQRIDRYGAGDPGPEGTVGHVFMPLGDYGFSKRFGWCADRFGVSWQLNFQ